MTTFTPSLIVFGMNVDEMMSKLHEMMADAQARNEARDVADQEEAEAAAWDHHVAVALHFLETQKDANGKGPYPENAIDHAMRLADVIMEGRRKRFSSTIALAKKVEESTKPKVA